MLRSYQSIYVSVYRWISKNFGIGRLPQFKSLFNVNFLLVILLTNAMLLAKLMLKMPGSTLSISSGTIIAAAAFAFLLLNYFMFLNNRWFNGINRRMATVSRRNINLWSVLLLVNVLFACGFCLIK